MAEPLRRLERAFFERLALVRLGGDSIRRSMAASSFYAAAEAVRAKRSGGLDFSKPPLIVWACQRAAERRLFFFYRRPADTSYLILFLNNNHVLMK